MGASGVAHNSYGGQHGQPSGYYSQETTHTFQDSHGGVKEVTEKKEKKSGKGGMLAAGAGGLAVGAVGGAVLAHEMGIQTFRLSPSQEILESLTTDNRRRLLR